MLDSGYYLGLSHLLLVNMHLWAYIALSETWVQHLTDDASESGSDYIR